MPKNLPIWVVIPTYWGHSDSALYDHPTPLQGQSTLPRILDSLVAQNNAPNFKVLILVAAVSQQENEIARERVIQLLAPFQNRLKLSLADGGTAEWIRGFPPIKSLSKISSSISMQGYGNIRNLQLLIPASMGAEVIIALDDDEVVPEDYLTRALKWIGKKPGNRAVTGVGGPYLDSKGSPYLPEPEMGTNLLTAKSVLINQTMRELMAKADRLIETPMIFGGNMIFHKKLFSQVCFDPAIPRGEDIDYLINAKIAGESFFFDPKLVITHLPPRHYESPEYGKMKQDLIRFTYEREKLVHAGLNPSAFSPYPGCLLDEEVIRLALEALFAIGSKAMAKRFGTPEEIVQEARDFAKYNLPRYFEFAKLWPEIIREVKNNRNFKIELELKCTSF
ncbi:MAG: hypothetical protein IMY80_01180 [Chloroflexi bacterium]|nr:hypothetical protein [Chloroflexota bacterium]